MTSIICPVCNMRVHFHDQNKHKVRHKIAKAKRHRRLEKTKT
jgi:uncharacterized Zn finger protein (UPF0148 family)